MGYMTSEKGIEPNPEKVEAILNMPKLTCMRDVQRLTGRVVALNRFMSRSVKRCLPFLKKLSKVLTLNGQRIAKRLLKISKNISALHTCSTAL